MYDTFMVNYLARIDDYTYQLSLDRESREQESAPQVPTDSIIEAEPGNDGDEGPRRYAGDLLSPGRHRGKRRATNARACNPYRASAVHPTTSSYPCPSL